MSFVSKCCGNRSLHLVAVTILILIAAIGYEVYHSQPTFCLAQLDLMMILDECITVKWRRKEGCKGDLQPLKLYIHNVYKLYNTLISNGQQRDQQAVFPKVYCVPHCTICTDDVHGPCLFYNGSKNKHNLKDRKL